MVCDILDLQCIFVNEIFGSVLLTAIGAAIIYFIVIAKLRIQAELGLAIAIPFVLISGMMIGGFQTVYAFATVIVALMLAFIFGRIIGNR